MEDVRHGKEGEVGPAEDAFVPIDEEGGLFIRVPPKAIRDLGSALGNLAHHVWAGLPNEERDRLLLGLAEELALLLLRWVRRGAGGTSR